MADPCRIPIGHGLFVLVSPEDFERVNAHKWHRQLHRARHGKVYAQRTIRLGPGRNGKQTGVALHRFIMGAKRGQLVDHRNGDGLDNQRDNLRLCTPRQNSQNVVESKNQKLGGFKGVSWSKRAGKWCAQIRGGPTGADGKRKQIRLGLFTDPIEAAKAYDRAAREHFGEFASLNFPETTAPAVAARRSTSTDHAFAAVVRGRKGGP